MMENHGSLMGKAMRGRVEGKRPRGRPRKRVMISEVCRIVPYNEAI